jgi:DNA-binding transcriptional ArsR family regulator
MTSRDDLVTMVDGAETPSDDTVGLDRSPVWPPETPDGVPALAKVFTLLSDETRLRIVFELVVRCHECPSNPTLSFSSLRSRVGARDAGRFNDHLRRLRDDLVEKVDEGYRLTPAGEAIGTTLVAGAIERLERAEPALT